MNGISDITSSSAASYTETLVSKAALYNVSLRFRARMSGEVQRADDSPSTSGGSSDLEQRETAPPEQEREPAQPKKKETKISSKTAAKLSTSAKRYVQLGYPRSVVSMLQEDFNCVSSRLNDSHEDHILVAFFENELNSFLDESTVQ